MSIIQEYLESDVLTDNDVRLLASVFQDTGYKDNQTFEQSSVSLVIKPVDVSTVKMPQIDALIKIMDERATGVAGGDALQLVGDDDSYDNAVDINAAIDAAHAAGGGRVLIAAVDDAYLLTTVVLKSNVILEAVGRSNINSRAVTLIWGGVAGGTMVSVPGSDSAEIRHIALDGDNVATIGLDVTSSSPNPTRNCRFIGMEIFNCTSGSGKGLSVGSDTYQCSENWFRDFWIHENDTNIYQHGEQTLNNRYGPGVLSDHNSYGADFVDGNIFTEGLVILSNQLGAVADIQIGTEVECARFKDNYHETFTGHTYYTTNANRARSTSWDGVFVQFSQGASPTNYIIRYRHNGPATTKDCEFKTVSNAPTEIGIVSWEPKSGGSPGIVTEIGSEYLNGAKVTVPVSSIAYASIGMSEGSLIANPIADSLGVYSSPEPTQNHYDYWFRRGIRIHEAELVLSDAQAANHRFVFRCISNVLYMRNDAGTNIHSWGIGGDEGWPTTDSSASPGAIEINKPTGKSAIAAGQTAVTITNSLVGTGSRIFITPIDIDTTVSKWKAVAGSGSFVVTADLAATGNWRFQWRVDNTVT